MPPHQFLRAADVNNLSVLDDRHPIAQPLGLLHQMSGHKDRLTAVTDAAHEFPDHPPRLRVEPSGQLIQKHDLRIVDQRQGDEQPLLLYTVNVAPEQIKTLSD